MGHIIGVFFLERSLGHYLEAFYRAIGVLFWRGAHYLDMVFLWRGHMTRVLLGKGAYLACLLFQNWLQGPEAYSLSIARGVLSNGAEAEGG